MSSVEKMSADDTLTMPAPTAQVSLVQIFLSFTKISLSSFGGGLSGWMMRDLVQNRKWISEQEFFTGLALAQALPGVNVVNLSIWIGYSLRGGPGALCGALGMVVPAMFCAIAILGVYGQVAHFAATNIMLAGVAAVAIGLSLQMGARAARRAATSAVPIAVLVATFFAIAILRLPLLPVVGFMAVISISAAFYRLRKAESSDGG